MSFKALFIIQTISGIGQQKYLPDPILLFSWPY